MLLSFVLLAYFLFGYENKSDITLYFPSGSTVSEISKTLEHSDVIHNSHAFNVFARFMQFRGRSIIAGEYLFTNGDDTYSVLKKLIKGDRVIRKISIPEGLTVKQIALLIDNTEGLIGDISTQLVDCDLMPNTYFYFYGDSKDTIIQRMRDAYTQFFAKHAGNPEYITSLAAIVEKETALESERKKVAGVYVNRIKQGMLLQADPTVIYAVTDGFGSMNRPISLADLKYNSPFNTYVTPGLPPRPIACPGKASLKAALEPEQHNLLYFVADGSGGHIFSSNLKEHNKNVANWRKVKKDMKSNAKK